MTGSHEVRGSIPLGSTNNRNNLGPLLTWPFAILCAYSVPTLRDHIVHTLVWSHDFVSTEGIENGIGRSHLRNRRVTMK